MCSLFFYFFITKFPNMCPNNKEKIELNNQYTNEMWSVIVQT